MRASISTPVGPVVAALLRMAMPSVAISVVTSRKVRGRGWHMGINSDVRFAAWIPAKRAISSGLPFGLLGNAASTSDESATKAEASASRRVADFGAHVDHLCFACIVEVRELAHTNSLNQQNGNGITGGEAFRIWWNDYERICARCAGKVA